MNRRAVLCAVLASWSALVVYGVLGLTACNGFPTDCVARGTSSSFHGAATYSTTDSTRAPGPTKGGEATSVVVYDAVSDLNGSCTYTNMEFPVTIGSCTLWAMLTSADGDAGPDGGSSLTASIEPGQSCTLPLETESVPVTVTSGSLTIDPTLYLALQGTVVLPTDGSTTNGFLQWSFVGQ